MIEISDTQIYGLNKAIVYSGLPMNEEPDMDYDRAVKLGSLSNGHDSYLKGITVTFKLKASQYFILQLQRYSFLQPVPIISSTSKMHMLENFSFLIGNMPNEITPAIKEEVVRLWKKWQDTGALDDYMKLYNNLPFGFTLMEANITNYMSLKNIYHQRENHKLPEWHYFCDWIKNLPLLSDILA